MRLLDLILMIIAAISTLVISLLIFKGGNKDKENLMSIEKCNNKDCDLCIDKEQCYVGGKDTSEG